MPMPAVLPAIRAAWLINPLDTVPIPARPMPNPRLELTVQSFPIDRVVIVSGFLAEARTTVPMMVELMVFVTGRNFGWR